jgi:hypothetical protein
MKHQSKTKIEIERPKPEAPTYCILFEPRGTGEWEFSANNSRLTRTPFTRHEAYREVRGLNRICDSFSIRYKAARIGCKEYEVAKARNGGRAPWLDGRLT